jgi:uncharacterized membrane protein
LTRLFSAALGAAVVLAAGSAEAGLRLCNNYNTTIYAAIGYNDQDQWIAEGWWEIFPGNCMDVINGPLNQRYYYARAEAPNGTFWGGDDYFCTMQTRFLVVDSENCVSAVMDREGFYEIDVGDSRDHIHNFNP